MNSNTYPPSSGSPFPPPEAEISPDNLAQKGRIWMPIYVGDYHADTTHFRTIDHGAYLLLLLSYWRRQGPLPADQEYLMTITKTSRREWHGVHLRVARLFQISKTHWTHLTLENEITKTQDQIAKKSKAGKAGMASRWAGDARTPPNLKPPQG